jgi:hypothetical protein
MNRNSIFTYWYPSVGLNSKKISDTAFMGQKSRKLQKDFLKAPTTTESTIQFTHDNINYKQTIDETT